MLPEAELFVMAEQMLVEVLGRIRPQDRDIELPPITGGRSPGSMAQAVELHARDEAVLTDALTRRGQAPAGGMVDAARRSAGGSDIAALAEAACAAALSVPDGDALVAGPDGDLPVREVLLRATVSRSLLAHYVAAYLGSTACPLPEELARPLWELTSPDAARWRALGCFRDPMPLPEHVSWRDRFLLSAGHEPHPLGH